MAARAWLKKRTEPQLIPREAQGLANMFSPSVRSGHRPAWVGRECPAKYKVGGYTEGKDIKRNANAARRP